MMSRPIRMLEIRSVRGTGGGPEKTILLGAARTDPARFAVTVCYLRDQRDAIFRIDEQAARLGVDYVEIRERHSFDPAVWKRLRRLVTERGIDIVHAHDYKTDFLAWLLARKEKAIPLATAHGWSGQSKRERLYYALDKRLLARFPFLIAVSSEIRAALLHYGAKPESVHTILNGIDHHIYQRHRKQEAVVRASLGIASGDIVLGGVGRLERQKRFDILLQAFAQVRARKANLHLFIVGDGSLRCQLEEEATRLGLGSACRFLGHRTDIAEIHHAFNLFVQSSDYEGTSNAVLEAMAMETPIIATAVGGTAELIQDRVHGLRVPPGDATALTSAIEEVLNDPQATARRRSAARTRVENELSFDRRMQAVEAIYEKLFSDHQK